MRLPISLHGRVRACGHLGVRNLRRCLHVNRWHSQQQPFQLNTQSVHSRMQQFRQDFQKLGQDLQTGNLTGAQADFAALQKDRPQPSSTQNSNPIAQELQQLSNDLQSGNLTAAQQDYTNLQRDFQNQAAQRLHHHHHHSGSQDSNAISQLFSQIGQDLQSGDMASAQQAYTTLQQSL